VPHSSRAGKQAAPQQGRREGRRQGAVSQRSRAVINIQEGAECVPDWRHLTKLGTAGRRAGGDAGTRASTAPAPCEWLTGPTASG